MVEKKTKFAVGLLEFTGYLLQSQSDTSGEKKESQIKKWLPFYLDRFLEVLKYYPLSPRKFLALVNEYDFPTTEYYKEKFTEKFTAVDPSGLYTSYADQDLVYTLRLMLGYTRIDYVLPYWNEIKKRISPESSSLLDYGGGVSDVGLFMAQKGAKVTIVELDTPKAHFTRKRFEARGYSCNLIASQDTETLPTIETKFDLIVATEILEHFRYPTAMISYFYDHLNPHGLLLNSMGTSFERETGGDHLDESLAEGNSKAYKENYEHKFKLIDVDHDHTWLFEKK